MKKRLVSLALALAMVLCMIPAGQVQAAQESFDNSNLSFGLGNTAYCPACEKTVAWTALGGDIKAAYWLKDGGHYYLSKDINSTAIDGAITVNTTAGKAACLHLNGHNITSTVDCTVTYYSTTTYGALNIMGNGTVSGAGVSASEKWRAATLNVREGGELNLYGGTYTKGASNAPVVWVWAGNVNMYDGAKLVGTDQNLSTYSSTVYLQNEGANFYMHGGEITGGTNLNSGGNVLVNNGAFVMNGGTISGGKANGYHGGNVYVKSGSFTMNGGTISGGTAVYHGSNVYVNSGSTARISGGTITSGNLYVGASDTTTLSGAPVIAEMKLPSGVKVALDGLTSAADIAVNASAGVFTNAGVSAAIGSFRTHNGTDSIVAKDDGSLAYFSNAKLSLDASGYAVCPACGTSVKWTALSGTWTSSFWMNTAGNHYYLSGDMTSSGGDGAIAVNVAAGNSVCLHLNGYNLNSTVDTAVRYYKDGTLNIMGNGTVSGAGVSASDKWRAATLNVTGGAKLNLYGGTFTKGASNAPVVWVWAGTANLYSGAKITGTSQNVSAYSSSVYLQNEGAAFNMYGGTISGGTNYSSGGNVCVNNGAFTMYGGTITGGKANGFHGGNVYVKGGSFTMNGGTVANGTATYFGSNIFANTGSKVSITGGTSTNGIVYVSDSGTTTISGAPKISRLIVKSGYTVNLGALVSGAKIVVNDTSATTADSAVLQSYVDAGYFVTNLEGKEVAVKGSDLIIQDIPVEEPEEPVAAGPVYITGNVLYETDFSDETVGALPAGWSAGYSEGDAESGTKTNFGWGSNGTMSAKVEDTAYGKAFHFTSGNNDAFVAMGEIPTTNYLYEATICVDRGYGSFGLANNYYASTDKATGALFSSIYPKGDAAKYTYKGAGLSGSQPWTTSYNPTSGQIVNLQILSLNGQNYIMYEGEIVAQCGARLAGQKADRPGFYVCYGGIYVLGVKVTEVFAGDVELASAKVSVTGEKTAAATLEVSFDKNQGLYTAFAGADSSKLSFGMVLAAGSEKASELTKETANVMVVPFSAADMQEDSEKIVCATSIIVGENDYDTVYSIRPFVEVDGICFYGDISARRPSELANGAYMSATEAGKALIARNFGGSAYFTADGNKKVTFTLFSDFHYVAGMYPSTISDLNTILKRADDVNASFVLSAGDFTNDMKGSPELYNTYRCYFTEEGDVLPAYNVYGNHELEFDNSMDDVTWTLTNDEYTDHEVVWGTADGRFNSQIGYYYFESDGFRVIALDSEYSYNPTTEQWEHNKQGSSGPASGNTKTGSLGPVQLAWLEEVLMDAAQKDIPCIVVAHDGFTGLSWGNTSPDSDAVRALYAKANAKNPGTVLMSINGHIHTDHQGWNDGVFYFDTNTVRNTWWQEKAEDHYTDEHTFLFEEYDEDGELVATYPKKYSELRMGKNTWFSEDPISCNITISESGIVSVDGMKSEWAYGIVPTAATTVDGVKPEIVSGTHWDCSHDGHVEQLKFEGNEYYIGCANTQCAYESVRKTHCGVMLQKADGTISFPESIESAIAQQGVLKPIVDGITIEIPAGQTLTLDLAGKKVNITGSGVLQGMDSANDDFAESTGAAMVAESVTVAMDVTGGENGYRYIALEDAGVYTFHRLGMNLSAVTLRPNEQCGIYYKAVYECDAALQAKIDSYGVVFSVKDMPGADFQTDKESNNCYTVYEGNGFVSGQEVTSGSIFGIMKNGLNDNAARGEMKIHATAYMIVEGQPLVSAGESYSLLDVMKAIDSNWQTYVDNGKAAAIQAFYAMWENAGMGAWADEFENIA